MYRGGHVGFNALLYAPVLPLASHVYSLELAVWGCGLAIVTATLPDVDERVARIDHRGPTHTLWFAILVGLLAGAATALVGFSAPLAAGGFGFVVGAAGVVAHLAGDVLTPMGISPLSPLWRAHVTFNQFKSKNAQINRALLIVGTLALCASLTLTTASTVVLALPTWGGL